MRGKTPREAMPSAVREQWARYYDDMANKVVNPRVDGAREFNLDRARYLRGEINTTYEGLAEWRAAHGR